jgi:aminopeptidase N
MLLTCGCQPDDLSASDSYDDPHSFARPWEARVGNLALDLTVDFDRKLVYGSAKWEVELTDEAKQLVLDINNLDIQRIALQPGDAAFDH